MIRLDDTGVTGMPLIPDGKMSYLQEAVDSAVSVHKMADENFEQTVRTRPSIHDPIVIAAEKKVRDAWIVYQKARYELNNYVRENK